MARGIFITFEGGEGAGKSTQLRMLADRLEAAGHRVTATREPGGAAGAEEIRQLLVTGATDRWTPMTEALLHFAARADHLARTVRPALARGAWVVSDRFADSTMAYQGYGHDLGRATIEALHRLVVGETNPDLTLILDLPIETGLARAAARAGHENRYEEMDRAFHERLRDAFLDIAAREPDRCVVIDASRAPEAVSADIWRTVDARLNP